MLTAAIPPRNPLGLRLAVHASRLVLALSVLLMLAPSANAQHLKPLKQAQTENREFVLTIDSAQPDHSTGEPDKTDAASTQPSSDAPSTSKPSDETDSASAIRNGRNGAGGVRATLRHLRSGHEERVVWQAQLINRLAPVQAIISDNGKFTITLDDYPVGGARHAVVVYNEQGELLREFSLRELLRKDDWKEVRERRGTIYWLRGAKMKFSRDLAAFRINLRSDREIVINLRKLEVEGGSPDAEDVPPEFAAILDQQATPNADVTQTLDDAVDHLRNVIAASGDAVTPEDIEQAQALVKSLLAQAADQSEVSAELVRQAMSELNAAEAAELQHLDKEKIAEAESNVSYAGNSGETGFGVPQPNPTDRVDYIAWMRGHTAIDGLSAAPVIAESVASLTKWEGDADLRDLAMKGDPTALQSPAIQAWIAANQHSIDLARTASELPYRGVQPQEGADSLIGVLLPDLGARREITRAAVVHGRTLAAGGDVAGARRDYIDAMRFGAQTGQGVTLIENLVGAAMQQPTSNALLDSFENDDSTDYASLASELESAYRPLRPTSELMQFERAAILETLQKTYEPDLDRGGYKVGGEGLRTLAEIGALIGKSEGIDDQLFMAQRLTDIGYENVLAQTNSFYDRFTSASQTPYAAAQPQLEAIEREIGDPTLAQQNPFVATLMPSLSRAMQATGRAEAQRRATLLVTNLKAYKQQNGTYPASLDVFGGRDWATDPLTGQAFHYEPTDGNFRLYSLGVNGTDEGGAHDSNGRENDTVFWPRPK